MSSWLSADAVGAAARPTRSNGDRSSSAPPPVSRSQALDPVVVAERDFLAQCFASPDAAAEMLATIDEDAFSGDGMRRVLRYVREHLREPEKGLAENEGLVRSIAALTARAAELQPSRAVLQAQFLNMRIARIDAETKERIRAGTGGVAELRRTRDTLVQRRDALLQEAMEESSPED